MEIPSWSELVALAERGEQWVEGEASHVAALFARWLDAQRRVEQPVAQKPVVEEGTDANGSPVTELVAEPAKGKKGK